MGRAGGLSVPYDSEFETVTPGWIEQDIPKRPWLARGYFLRGSVTILAGPGSAGKSSLAIGWATAAALGRPWHRFTPATPLRVLLYNVEDDPDEQRRRFSAALRQFDRTPADLKGQIFGVQPKNIGTLVNYDPQSRDCQGTKLMFALEDAIRAFRPNVLMLDPLVELHDGEENDNTGMRAIIAFFRTIAQTYDLAVLILHHTRKGSGNGAGEQDIFRGAGSSVAAARVALTVLPMTPDEAKEFNVHEDLRRQYVRVDSAKANYTPASAAEWFQLIEYDLDNTDAVAAVVPWFPPTEAPLEPERQDELATAVADGINGEPYSPRFGDNEPRSIAKLLRQFGFSTRNGQYLAFDKLLAKGFIVTGYRNHNRKKRQGIRSPDGNPNNVEWLKF